MAQSRSSTPENTKDQSVEAPELVTETVAEPKKQTEQSKAKQSTLADRLPKGIDIGQPVFFRPERAATLCADKVRAITLRESNVEIELESSRKVNAADIGKYLFKRAEDAK